MALVALFLLAERQVYLARAVQRLDPVKLLLAQAAVGPYREWPAGGALAVAIVAAHRTEVVCLM